MKAVAFFLIQNKSETRLINAINIAEKIGDLLEISEFTVQQS